MREWLESVVLDLEHCSYQNYGEIWCRHRMHFFHSFAQGKILSTRFGMDFFSKLLDLLKLGVKERTKYLQDHNGNLGEYDKNLLEILKQADYEAQP